MYIKLAKFSPLVPQLLKLSQPLYDILEKQPRAATPILYNNRQYYLIADFIIPDLLVEQTFDHLVLPDRSKLPINPFVKE